MTGINGMLQLLGHTPEAGSKVRDRVGANPMPLWDTEDWWLLLSSGAEPPVVIAHRISPMINTNVH